MAARYDARVKDDGKHEGPARTSPYPASRLGASIRLVDTAREIEQADRMLGAVAGGKLDVIARQIRALQREAQEILERAQRDLELHRAECAFQKRPGATYHLYERANGSLYFSMLSVEEWGGAPPHPHRGSYRLELDQSWTPVNAET